MKTITKTFEVFTFDELNQTAKDKVVNNTIGFILEVGYSTPNIEKAVEKAEKLRTPWFTGEHIWSMAKEDVLSLINDYEYLADGEIFNES